MRLRVLKIRKVINQPRFHFLKKTCEEPKMAEER